MLSTTGAACSWVKPGRYLHFFLSFFLPLTNLKQRSLFLLSAGQATRTEKETPVATTSSSEVSEHLRKLAADSPIHRRPVVEPPKPSTVQRQKSVVSAALAGSGLYVVTFLIECVSALVRSVIITYWTTVALSPLYLLIFATNNNGFNSVQDNIILCVSISLVIGFGTGCWPLLMSLFHIVFPFSASWRRTYRA